VKTVDVFYAWQSDTPQRFNRYLIRTALEVVARQLNNDTTLEVKVRIHSDTEGVPGQAPVTDTILKKIDACDIFVPDLSFVARTDGVKLVPNPNVMIEWGYALKAKGHAAMLPIMNTTFGLPENLPFDMGHLRHPIRYDASPTAKNAERRAARSRLCKDIEEAMRVMLNALITHAKEVRIAEENNHRSVSEEKSRKQKEAQKYLAPELQRTIERVFYIHGRAIANFICHSADNGIKPNDQKRDFIPYWPSLYPNAPQVRELGEEDTAALIAFYDSLHSLNDHVNDWWEREGQLPVNIFNSFLHDASKSLKLALICIDEFGLEELFPPPYEAWGTISSRIRQSLKSEEEVRKHHIARFEAKAAEAKAARENSSRPPRGFGIRR